MCADGSCVAYDACCPDVPPALCDPQQCLAPTCDGGTSTCASICQSGEICCQGACLTHPCDNGCDLSADCSRCNAAPSGKTYCAAQDQCVTNQCPSGQQYDEASCQCVPVACPSGSVSCPPVPAMGWPHDGGTVDLPAGCCPTWKFVANAPGWDADICAEPVSGGSAWVCD
jgi:hypothetical protein